MPFVDRSPVSTGNGVWCLQFLRIYDQEICHYYNTVNSATRFVNVYFMFIVAHNRNIGRRIVDQSKVKHRVVMVNMLYLFVHHSYLLV